MHLFHLGEVRLGAKSLRAHFLLVRHVCGGHILAVHVLIIRVRSLKHLGVDGVLVDLGVLNLRDGNHACAHRLAHLRCVLMLRLLLHHLVLQVGCLGLGRPCRVNRARVVVRY